MICTFRAKKLGEGAYSIVKEAQSRKTGGSFAVKIVTRANLEVEDEEALLDEIDILQSLNHINIIKLYDVYCEEFYYYLVTERMRGGELFDRIVEKESYNEKEAKNVCKILFGAIEYCHSQKIAHRDLKPENLLLVNDRDDTQIKIADFGFAKRVKGRYYLSTQCGTPGYVAPEILEGIRYGIQVDMWSLGVIIYILLGGYPPFAEDRKKDLYRKVRNAEYEFHPKYWRHISKDVKDLIRHLLIANPDKRFTAKDALQHRWIVGHDDNLERKDLKPSLDMLKEFNKGRKFKGAVKAVRRKVMKPVMSAARKLDYKKWRPNASKVLRKLAVQADSVAPSCTGGMDSSLIHTIICK